MDFHSPRNDSSCTPRRIHLVLELDGAVFGWVRLRRSVDFIEDT